MKIFQCKNIGNFPGFVQDRIIFFTAAMRKWSLELCKLAKVILYQGYLGHHQWQAQGIPTPEKKVGAACDLKKTHSVCLPMFLIFQDFLSILHVNHPLFCTLLLPTLLLLLFVFIFYCCFQ